MDEDISVYDRIIITIVVDDPDHPNPKIDLDGCHPYIAAAIFEDAADMLRQIVLKPKIYSNNELIAIDEIDFIEEFMDLDEDDE